MSDINPYAAPESSGMHATDAEQTVGGRAVASQNRRFVNFLIDNVIVRILAFMGGLAVGASMAAASGGQIPPSELWKVEAVGMLVGLVIVLLYYVLMEAVFGVTIGKLVTGTKVLSSDGNSPGIGQIVGRSFARMIPFEPFSFVFGDKTTGWHDSLSGTRVVMNR